MISPRKLLGKLVRAAEAPPSDGAPGPPPQLSANASGLQNAEPELAGEPLAEELRGLRILHSLSTRLVTEENLRAIYEGILQAAIELTRADAGTVQTLDAETQELVLLTASNISGEMTEWFFRVDAGSNTPCGRALQTGRRVFVDFDQAGLPDEDGSLRRHVEEGLLSGQSTPLLTRSGAPIGMVSTQWRESGHRPSERELGFLDLLARQAADLVEQRQSEAARRESEDKFAFHDLKQAKEVLRENELLLAGQKEAFQAAVNGAPLEESLGALVQTAVARMGEGTRCGFYLADAAGRELRHVAGMSKAYAECMDGLKIGADSLACGLAVHTGQPVITPDVTLSPLWKPWLRLAEMHDYRASWSFPIEAAAGKTVGSFAVYFQAPREATPRECEFAALLTRAAAMIISRTQEAEERVLAEAALRETTQQLAREQEAARQLQGISSRLIKAEGRDKIYDHILDAAMALMHADFGSIQLVEASSGTLSLLASKNFHPESTGYWRSVFADLDASFGSALQRGERFVVPDVRGSGLAFGSETRAQFRLSGIAAVQSTPLKTREGRVIGLMSTFWREPHTPDEGELASFDVLARQTTDVIERHRSQQTLRENEELLRESNALFQQRLGEWKNASRRTAEDRIAALNLIEDALAAREESERAALARRESEDRLRTLADAVPQIIWANSGDGVANYFNRRWYEYSGLSYEESAGPGWEAIVHPEDAPRAVPAWKAALETGEIFDIEYRLRGADNRFRWFIGRNVPMRDTEGRVIGWFGTATDIHDLKRAEARLRASEEQFRRAIEDAPIPVIMHAEDGQVLQVSKTWTDLTGYAPEDIPIFDAWLNRAYGGGADELRAHMRQLFRGEKRQMSADFDVTTLAGDLRRWSFSASAPGTLLDGRRFIVAMALDITEREQAERALRESEERLGLVIENAREYAIFSMDLERRVETWNAGAQAILGYAQEEAIGQSADMIFTAEDRAAGAPDEEAAVALASGRAVDERWHVRKDGSRFWGSGVMTTMHNAEGEAIGLLKIFRDQTEERRAKQALEQSLKETQEARAEAEAAGQAKDHFLAVISHELRTPLTPVLMAAGFLARSKELSEDTLEAIEMIRRNVQLESRFIDDLLDVTRLGHGKFEIVREPLDLHEVIRHAVAVSESDFKEKGQRLTADLAATEHRVTGDFTRLQQVVWNLLKNASKFALGGGEIQVRTRNEPGVIVVEVSDNGIGIEAEALSRIFDAFAQANETITRRFGGLGLGLAIAKGAVDAHGGQLRADSAGVGKGATFSVILPLT